MAGLLSESETHPKNLLLPQAKVANTFLSQTLVHQHHLESMLKFTLGNRQVPFSRDYYEAIGIQFI